MDDDGYQHRVIGHISDSGDRRKNLLMMNQFQQNPLVTGIQICSNAFPRGDI